MANNRLSRRISVQSTIRNSRLYQMDNIDKLSNINFEDDSYAEFVKSTFNSVECSYFKEDPRNSTENERRCYCGESKSVHAKDETPYNSMEEWDQKRCMKEFPTNAFGQIEFSGEGRICNKPAEFVRIRHDDRMEDVMELLFKYWNINIGGLCISVIGGAKNFKMAPKDKEVFTQGLVKAAQTTNALIITSGLNSGITRVVGDALQEGHTLHFDKKQHNNALCCLGISPWGYVMNRDILNNANGRRISYKVSNEIKTKQPVSLNKNHTHYLFVDEGRRNGFANTEAGNFRASLEKNLAQGSGAREAIPVVLVIVEGGHDVFHEASRSVKENVPIVICDGTGRASDILGESYRMMPTISGTSDGFRHLPDDFIVNLKKKLVDQAISDPKKVDEAIRHIETIVQNQSLITLFNMKITEDLDRAILYSLIKKMKDSRGGVGTSICHQIQLCLTWNRVDIAKEKIFRNNVELTTADWNKLMDIALKNCKFQFVELFLLNGAIINEYLTPNILNDLYKNSIKTESFRRTVQFYLKTTSFTGLHDVKELLSKMIGRCEMEKYKDSEEDRFRHPYQELFCWAILMEKFECAKLFWERSEESILLSLLATKIIMMINLSTNFHETKRIEMLTRWKDYYENIAIKVLEECHEMNKESAAYIIERKNPQWGDLTCLELAHRANDQRFISSMVCQNSIDYTWRSGLKVGFARCLLAIFFPYLIFKLRTYKDDDSTRVGEHFKNSISMNKLRLFYTAPQTKFWIHLTIYIVFLLYFSVVVISQMKRNTFTIHEIILMTYLVLMIVDTIFQILRFKTISSKPRFVDWFQFSAWNQIDFVLIFASLLAMFLRIRTGNTLDHNWVMRYRVSKTVYSLIVGCFYLKWLRFIIIHPNLGPKMVMIAEMIRELMLYLVIILTILLAYGVTSQASYYPERQFNIVHLSSILDTPYWTLFGELNLQKSVYLSWCDDNLTDFSGSNECPESNVVIPIIYSVYIFVANILLLNVLIAIFSNIFNNVHKNSIIVWKFNMYLLGLEYQSRTLLPTPFSIIFYCVEFIVRLYRKRCCNISKSSVIADKNFDTVIEDNVMDLQLRDFEKKCLTSILKEMNSLKQYVIGENISRLETWMKKLTDNVSIVNSKVDKFQKSDSHLRFSKNSLLQGDQTDFVSRRNLIAEDTVLEMTDTMNNIVRELRQLKNDSGCIDHDLIANIKQSNDNMKSGILKTKRKIKKLTNEIKDTMLTIQTLLQDQLLQPSFIGSSTVMAQSGSGDLHALLAEVINRDTDNKQQIHSLEVKVDDLKRFMEDSLKAFEVILQTSVYKASVQ